MAGCSKKQYAIMMSAGPEGKKLASEMGGMEQDKFNEAFAELLNSENYKPAEGEAKYSREEDEDYREFDETNEDDFGFDEDDSGDIYKEYDLTKDMISDKIFENFTLSEEIDQSGVSRLMEFVDDEFGVRNLSEREEIVKDFLKDQGIRIAGENDENKSAAFEGDPTANMKRSEYIDYLENEKGWDHEAAVKQADMFYDREDGTRGEPGPGPHSTRDYVYERNHPDLGEDKRPQMNRNKKSDSDNLNPDNPKYKGFQRSSITNAKLVDEGYEFTDADTGEKRKESIISYIPYGSLQDGDNRRLYAIVNNYDGTDTPKTGAIVAHSLEDARDQLERQTQLGIQGRDRYLGRGKYDEGFFNIMRDFADDTDPEDVKSRQEYSKKYGWDFNKPFAEHDFMKDDPYEKWKSDRIGNRKGKVGSRELSLNELIEKTNKLDDRELARDIIAINAPNFNLSEKEILDYYDKVGKR